MSPQQNEPGNGTNLEWVEQRRAALERYMNRTAQHPVLRVDLDFINFLESDQVSKHCKTFFEHVVY